MIRKSASITERYIAASLSYLFSEQVIIPGGYPVGSVKDLIRYAETNYGINNTDLFKYLYVGDFILEPVALGSLDAERDYYINHNPEDLDVHSVFFKYLPEGFKYIDFDVKQLYETLYLFTENEKEVLVNANAANELVAGSAMSFFVEMIKSGDLLPFDSDEEDIRFAVYLAVSKANGESPTAFGFHEYRARFNKMFCDFVSDYSCDGDW